jgi:paraquat-inducible protein B
MSKKANPTLIGAFTLVGLVLAAVAVVLFGAGKYFEKSHRILLHFEKSAIGLLVGSDVRFGGVRIGRVASISVLVDQEKNRKIIPVIVELGETDLQSVGATTGSPIDFSSDAGVQKAVKEGLRAGMKQQSLLTGMLYIEFDIVPDVPGFVYEGPGKADYPTVPTIPTEIDELIAGVADGLKKINALDLPGVIKDLRTVLVSAESQLKELNMKAINDNVVEITKDIRAITSNEKLTHAFTTLDEALVDLKALIAKADKGIEPIMADIDKVAIKANTSLSSIETASNDLSKLANPRGPLIIRVQTVLQETERAARAIKELADDLKRNPNAILKGKEQKP